MSGEGVKRASGAIIYGKINESEEFITEQKVYLLKGIENNDKSSCYPWYRPKTNLLWLVSLPRCELGTPRKRANSFTSTSTRVVPSESKTKFETRIKRQN